MKEFDRKISYKLLNISLIFLVIYLFGKTMFVWQPILIIIKNILIPFLIAFAIAYALYPIILKLREKGMRKSFAIFFLIFVLIFFIGFIVYLLIPLLVEQLNSLFNWLLEIIPNVSNKYDINLSFVQEYLGDFNSIFR